MWGRKEMGSCVDYELPHNTKDGKANLKGWLNVDRKMRSIPIYFVSITNFQVSMFDFSSSILSV